jgi:dimethylargininase
MPGIALVRRPSPRLAEGIVTHVARVPVDLGLALRQHEEYAAALAGCGWTVRYVAPADGCPDSVFVEDTVVVCGDLAVLTRPGAAQRRPEVSGAEEAVRGAGLRVVRIEEPGTLDGGDVLQVGDTAYVVGVPTAKESGSCAGTWPPWGAPLSRCRWAGCCT